MKQVGKRVWLLLALAAASCGRPALKPGGEISRADFAQRVEQASGWVLVDFWATWCPPCQKMKPIVERVERDYAGRLTVVQVDVDRNPDLARSFNVEGIPTFVLFRDGRLQDTVVGGMEESVFRGWLDKRLAAP